jgi:hypothetical protein
MNTWNIALVIAAVVVLACGGGILIGRWWADRP